MPDNPIARAPAGVKSIMRPRIKGPRSLMRTTTDRPVRIFVTCTLVPKGNLRCAAVNPDAGAYSPLAVLPPLYTDAIPVWGSAITGEENEIPARKIKAPAAQARPCIHAPPSYRICAAATQLWIRFQANREVLRRRRKSCSSRVDWGFDDGEKRLTFTIATGPSVGRSGAAHPSALPRACRLGPGYTGR